MAWRLLLLVFLVAQAACERAPNSTPRQLGILSGSVPNQVIDGRQIYNARCYFCHGYSGDARTVAATYLTPPPRDFTAAGKSTPRDAMIQTVRSGRPGSAMQGFEHLLDTAQIEAVVDFVRMEFMQRRAENTRYHTAANGWADHERYRAAFPFVYGQTALDSPWENLSAQQRSGKRLFLAACATCHDRSRQAEAGLAWQARPISYPRNGFSLAQGTSVDAITSASPYVKHDQPPQTAELTEQERRGEVLYQANCAFCHAADGTGKNWIGGFLEPHPRDLTDPSAMAGMDRSRLRNTIRDGLLNTTMPAWKDILTETEIDAVASYVIRVLSASDTSPRKQARAQ